MLALAGLSLPAPLLAKGLAACGSERQLSFLNTHTGETLTCVTYWANGTYFGESLAQIDHVLRDHRTGEITNIDLFLLDQLSLLNQALENDRPFHVISGYRSPETNRSLRLNGTGGVVKGSFHTKGRAIDLRIPGLELKYLRMAAISMHQGGVGYYPDSQFVHLDTGVARTWRG